jgi:ATP-binding cassette subfamily B protein
MRGTARAAAGLLTLGWRLDRGRLVRAALLVAAGYLATPAAAWALKAFTDAALAGAVGRACVVAAGLSVLLVMELMCAHFAHLSYYELAELAQVQLNGRLFTAAAERVPLGRREQPDYADTLHLAQQGLRQVTQAVEAQLRFGGLVLQLAAGTVLLAGLHPLLALLPLLAVVLVVSSQRAQRLLDRAQAAAAAEDRRAEHLLDLCLSPTRLMDLHLHHLQAEVLDRHRRAWQAATATLRHGLFAAAAVRCGGQTLFAVGYVGALVLVVDAVLRGRATIGDVVLVLALAVGVGTQVSTAVTLLTAVHRAGITLQRVRWLGDPDPAGPDRPAVPRAPSITQPALVSTPARSDRPAGITLQDVSFRYPGRADDTLRQIDVDLPAGAVVAVVGENGAGKSTLVKLLCGLYTPTAGRIIGLRGRVACLFQDFARVELSLLESVGVGDIERCAPPAVAATLGRAGAGELTRRLPAGLRTVLGQGYQNGVDLSGGEWQKVALARALMRPDAALLTLDEPAAALDASAEHALFARFAAEARDRSTERAAITLFVSHRFSTVRMADLILVLDRGRLVEHGSHDALMAADGLYAELFTLQAATYG